MSQNVCKFVQQKNTKLACLYAKYNTFSYEVFMSSTSLKFCVGSLGNRKNSSKICAAAQSNFAQFHTGGNGKVSKKPHLSIITSWVFWALNANVVALIVGKAQL